MNTDTIPQAQMKLQQIVKKYRILKEKVLEINNEQCKIVDNIDDRIWDLRCEMSLKDAEINDNIYHKLVEKDSEIRSLKETVEYLSLANTVMFETLSSVFGDNFINKYSETLRYFETNCVKESFNETENVMNHSITSHSTNSSMPSLISCSSAYDYESEIESDEDDN